MMSAVIIGGNECMVRRYIDLCNLCGYNAKVYPKMTASLKNIGNPDLLVVFTGTVSHTMTKRALKTAQAKNIKVVRSHTSSIAALGKVLQAHGV